MQGSKRRACHSCPDPGRRHSPLRPSSKTWQPASTNKKNYKTQSHLPPLPGTPPPAPPPGRPRPCASRRHPTPRPPSPPRPQHAAGARSPTYGRRARRTGVLASLPCHPHARADVSAGPPEEAAAFAVCCGLLPGGPRQSCFSSLGRGGKDATARVLWLENVASPPTVFLFCFDFFWNFPAVAQQWSRRARSALWGLASGPPPPAASRENSDESRARAGGAEPVTGSAEVAGGRASGRRGGQTVAAFV